MAKKNKYYVVWKGRETGIFSDWDNCEKQVKGFEGAKYKGFPTEQEAKTAFEASPEEFIAAHPQKTPAKSARQNTALSVPLHPALCVDAACSGNPGIMEYRGVYLLDIHQDGSRETAELFHRGTFQDATNNIGEFLALVHGLSLLQQQGNTTLPVYSDSRTAMSWVRNRKAKTKLSPTPNNAVVFELIRRAELWLNTHTYKNPIHKWDTDHWGEIPADFGRK